MTAVPEVAPLRDVRPAPAVELPHDGRHQLVLELADEHLRLGPYRPLVIPQQPGRYSLARSTHERRGRSDLTIPTYLFLPFSS